MKSFLHTLLGVHRTRGVWIPSPSERRFKIVLSRLSYPLRAANRGLFREVAWRFLADSASGLGEFLAGAIKVSGLPPIQPSRMPFNWDVQVDSLHK